MRQTTRRLDRNVFFSRQSKTPHPHCAQGVRRRVARPVRYELPTALRRVQLVRRRVVVAMRDNLGLPTSVADAKLPAGPALWKLPSTSRSIASETIRPVCGAARRGAGSRQATFPQGDVCAPGPTHDEQYLTITWWGGQHDPVELEDEQTRGSERRSSRDRLGAVRALWPTPIRLIESEIASGCLRYPVSPRDRATMLSRAKNRIPRPMEVGIR
jgi:hypothetical protein